jgi:hypothetical protein
VAFTYDQIVSTLEKVDLDLGWYSIATFCLWHTATHYFFQERRYSDSEALCRQLSKRILGSESIHPQNLSTDSLDFVTADTLGQNLANRVLEALLSDAPDLQPLHYSQLAFDAVQTLNLLGRSQEEQAKSLSLLAHGPEARRKFEQALLNFVTVLHLRRLTAQPGIWDPLLKAILVALISVGNVLGHLDSVKTWQKPLQAMVSNMEENYKAQSLLENKVLASTAS